MTNQALARKWRPKNFDSLVGQDFAIQAIKNSISNNRLHHAYLFSGTRGVGKTTIARIFAKCLNCQEGVSSNPCCSCSSCIEIDQSKSIDVIELDAASNTQVDNMRDLMDNANYQPTSSKYKVFIIDEVHMLSKSSFNAMLKTLEEPPAHVIFILATTDPDKIPVTVISRCLHFSLLQMTEDELIDQLKLIFEKESILYEEDVLTILAQNAQGSMRDALSLADRVINYSNGEISSEKLEVMLGIISKKETLGLIENILNKNKDDIWNTINYMKKSNVTYENILKDLSGLIYDISSQQMFDLHIKELEKLKNIVDQRTLQVLYQITIQGLKEINLAPNPFIGFTMTIIRLMNFVPNRDENLIYKPLNNKQEQEQEQEQEQKQEQVQVQVQEQEQNNTLSEKNWRKIVDGLENGMAKTLAQNCVIFSRDQNMINMGVDEKFKHLNNEKYINILEASLSRTTGEKIKLSIIETTSSSTPANEIKNEKKDAIDKASNSIKSDKNLEKILNEFDGEIIEKTIKPIN